MARARAHADSSASPDATTTRTRVTHIVFSVGLVALLVAAGAFTLMRGENERASSLPAPLPSSTSLRRAAPPMLEPPPSTSTTAVPVPVAPAPAPAFVPAPAPVATSAPAPAPEPDAQARAPQPAPPPSTTLSGAAGQMVGLINGVRAGLGLAPYAVDGELTANAQNWARSMAAAATISHQADLSVGLSSPWIRLGENVGVGPSVVVVHNALVASPGHYANIADRSFGSVGVGVVESGGTLYIAEEFMQH